MYLTNGFLPKEREHAQISTCAYSRDAFTHRFIWHTKPLNFSLFSLVFREVGLFLLSFNLKTQLELVKSIIILVNVGQTISCLFLSRDLEEDLIFQHSKVGSITLPILFQKSKLIVPWG